MLKYHVHLRLTDLCVCWGMHSTFRHFSDLAFTFCWAHPGLPFPCVQPPSQLRVCRELGPSQISPAYTRNLPVSEEYIYMESLVLLRSSPRVYIAFLSARCVAVLPNTLCGSVITAISLLNFWLIHQLLLPCSRTTTLG